MGVLIEVFTPQNNSKTATGHLSPPTNNVRDLKSLLLSWNCILVHLICLKSEAVMVCVWLQPFMFFIFFTLAQSVISSLFFSFSGSFSSILLTVFFSQQHIFNTFRQKDVPFTLFGFLEYFLNFSIVVLLTKLNPVVVC